MKEWRVLHLRTWQVPNNALLSLFTLTCSLQLYYLPLTILALLPLSLPIDGSDWSANFRGWQANWWAVLMLNGSVVYLGGNFMLQVRRQTKLLATLRACGMTTWASRRLT